MSFIRTDIKKVFFLYPPAGKFLRGEDRCQSDVEASAATSERAPLDIMQMAGVLKSMNIECRFVDCEMESKNWEDFSDALKSFNPDCLIVSTTNASVLKDLKACDLAKSVNPAILTLMKGALFYQLPLEVLKMKEFCNLDIALRIEPDTLLKPLIHGIANLKEVKSIFYQENGEWFATGLCPFLSDLDTLPLPDRSIIRNELYIRPDTGKPMTIIQTSRGCPFQCLYCLTPRMSGNTVRHRSAANIVAEIEECVSKYGIFDFFLRADTFTINKSLTLELCRLILEKKLKIQWVANSRTNTLDEEMIAEMKKAGCNLIAFGFEVGTNEAKERIRKGATVEQDVKARDLCKKYGIPVFGFFMMGFPWETRDDIKKTVDYMFSLNCEFIELHLATPFIGTELYNIALEEELIQKESDVIGHTYFSNPSAGTKFLSTLELLDIRKKALRQYYLRPSYILKRLPEIRNLKMFKNYLTYGLRLLKNTLKH